jgi:hypothetical protein
MGLAPGVEGNRFPGLTMPTPSENKGGKEDPPFNSRKVPQNPAWPV